MDQILDRHRPPNNFPTLDPPKVNPEVAHILSQAYVKRDQCHARYQLLVGKSTSALGKCMNYVINEIKNNVDSDLKMHLLPHLADVGTFMTQLFHEISTTRREYISQLLSKSVKDTIKETIPGEYLYGTDLAEKIKMAKIAEKAGNDLRQDGYSNKAGPSGIRRGGGTPLSASMATPASPVREGLGAEERANLQAKSPPREQIPIKFNPPSGQQINISGREIIRQGFQLRGISDEAVETIIDSISTATISQYACTYRLWYKYCEEKQIPVFQANVLQVIEFLQNIINTTELNYGSLNSHRSAISLISSDSLGSHPLIKRFMKGVARRRPMNPRYRFTWNPQPVLTALGNLPNNQLKSLTHKLVTLLSLVTGGRLQTISLIRVSNIHRDESRLQIMITDPVKTSLSLNDQPFLSLPFFTPNPSICPASTVLQYLESTKEIRNNEDLLFLTYVKPHKKATKQTLARWVKQTLMSSGVNTTVFKPHSTRHAATSAVRRAGLSVDTICKTAGWSQKTATFARFYDRPLQADDDFANTILSTSIN
ncbi:unnamed protein product [Acanthoscelides obtectus]|uniref:Tyr recombinase domain-containing protein n=1 Tax=Acanthoscelides obtectus TaxID=200917 RepID=A0A9P0M960_ACAOB|nr:unnamed protein product [Acanthoscelides obtectus]CAK1646903.1 hypothetical protein AOBTE_LOCUS14933 [Acanthoscelides obtectus]